MRLVRYSVVLLILVAVPTPARSNDQCDSSREAQIKTISKIIQSAQKIVERIDPVPAETAEWLKIALRESIQNKDTQRFLSTTEHPSYNAWNLRKNYSEAEGWLKLSQKMLQPNPISPETSKSMATGYLVKAIKAFNDVRLSIDVYESSKAKNPSLRPIDFAMMSGADHLAIEDSIDLLSCMLSP